MVSEDFIEGAEGFRKMLLKATKPTAWPHIEGVFVVFATVNGFESADDVVDKVLAEQSCHEPIDA